jgi:hypothetical protein
MTTHAITELQQLHVKSREGNRQAQKEAKNEVFAMLTDMKSTLAGVLTSVSTCEQTCLSLCENVSRLAAEGAGKARQTQALLSSLQKTTLETKTALEHDASQGQGGGQSDETVLRILEEMRVKFAEQMRRQEVSVDLQTSLSSALAEMRQQLAERARRRARRGWLPCS